MHLRIFGPVDVAIHMMDRVVTIVACEPIDHGAGEVPGRVHVHLGTFMFSQDDVLCPIMLKHIPQLKHLTELVFICESSTTKNKQLPKRI